MTRETLQHETRSNVAHRPADRSADLWRITVGDVLRRSAERFPDRAAVLWPDGPRLCRLTWLELLDAAERAAAVLLAHVAPGDPVAVWGPNSADWVVIEYATALAGTPLVPVNTALTDAEVEYQLRQSGSSLILAAQEHRGSPLHRRALALAASLPFPCRVLAMDAWRDAPPSAPGRLPVIAPESPFLIQYTSGTTGTPKGAVLSHLAGVNSGRFGAARLGKAERHEILCTPLPLHHVGASVCGVLAVGSFGGTLVLSPSFNARDTLRLVEQSRATVLGMVPTMMTDILACPDLWVRDLTSLRVVESGGTAVAPELIRRFEDALGVRVNIAYGQSESPYAVSTSPDDPDELKAETLGRPSPHREVRIVRPGTGETADLGEHGELCIRSPLNMSGYHGMAEATSQTIDADGWLYTGDICSMDARGVLRFHGRTRELIIRGGENVYPREVEETLLNHPAVVGAAVIGMPDDRLGEMVAAVVQLRPGCCTSPQELAAFARERLAPFKVPRLWHFADEFPLTASGKVRKHVLRDNLVAEGD